MATKNKLESFIENPRISLWKLTIPMAIGLFVNSIYILVDTYFLGSKIGTSAISALGYVMPFYFIIMGKSSLKLNCIFFYWLIWCYLLFNYKKKDVKPF